MFNSSDHGRIQRPARLPPHIYRDCDRARAARLSTPIGSRVV
jgi:hypothetical protein